MRRNKNYYRTKAEKLANNLHSMRKYRDLTQQTIADELNRRQSTLIMKAVNNRC